MAKPRFSATASAYSLPQSGGKIQACQIRFTGTLKPNMKRYLWLSLPAMNSAGSGTPLHFAGWKSFGQLILENRFSLPKAHLKADVVNRFVPNFLLASSGVGCITRSCVNLSRGKSLYLAFDNDYQENPAVLRQLAKLLKLRLNDNQKNQSPASTKIFIWSQTEKGIDDALLKAKNCVKHRFSIGFHPLMKNAAMTCGKFGME